jgi:hypothetical protein
MLEMLGLPNYSVYMRGTKSVGVYSERDVEQEMIEVTPKKNGGGRSGFTPIPERAQTFDYDSPEQLGEAVIAAFEHATT